MIVRLRVAGMSRPAQGRGDAEKENETCAAELMSHKGVRCRFRNVVDRTRRVMEKTKISENVPTVPFFGTVVAVPAAMFPVMDCPLLRRLRLCVRARGVFIDHPIGDAAIAMETSQYLRSLLPGSLRQHLQATNQECSERHY